MPPRFPLRTLAAGLLPFLLIIAGCQNPAAQLPVAQGTAFIPAERPAPPARTTGVIQAIDAVSDQRQVVLFKEDASGTVRRVMVIAIPDAVRLRMIGSRMVFVDTLADPAIQRLTGGRQIVRVFDDAFQPDGESTSQIAGDGS